PYWLLCESVGRPAARQWWELCREGVDALAGWLGDSADCARGGLMQLAVNQAELEEMKRGVAWLSEDGFEPRMMSDAAATNMVNVAGNLGVTYLPGALRFDPALALVRLSERLLEREGGYFEESGAVQVDLDNPPGVKVATALGLVEAEVAVLAAGHGNAALAPEMGRRLFPLRGQCLATAPLPAGMRGATVAVTANRGHECYRSLPDGRLLVAGIHPASGYREKTETLEVDPVFQSHLERFLGERCPEASGARISNRWACVYTWSADGLPLVGPLPGHIRVYLASGFASRSWSLGVGAGRLIARMLAGETVRFPTGSSPRRFL
ncbi:MAG: FAD-binding oxidoreductase, partial [Candidatus Eremiobacterota bacterium]